MKNLHLILPLCLLFFSACEYGRMWETPAVKPHEEKIMESEAETVPFEEGEAIYRAMPAEEIISPLKMSSEIAESGKKLYFTYCAQCHGKYYDGNGTVGQSFHPLPTDLRSSLVQSKHEGELFKSISYGLPKSKIPPLATTIAIDDRWKIIAHLKSLGSSE